MDNTKNRQRHIKIPYNIWTGKSNIILQPSETICEDCGGCGGYDYTTNASGLIKRCDSCRGRGYFDWIHTAKGKVKEQYSYFIGHTTDQVSTVIKKEEEENYIKQVRLQLTGTFKFISKDDI